MTLSIYSVVSHEIYQLFIRSRVLMNNYWVSWTINDLKGGIRKIKGGVQKIKGGVQKIKGGTREITRNPLKSPENTQNRTDMCRILQITTDSMVKYALKSITFRVSTFQIFFPLNIHTFRAILRSLLYFEICVYLT